MVNGDRLGGVADWRYRIKCIRIAYQHFTKTENDFRKRWTEVEMVTRSRKFRVLE